ncbi:hypothetical protein Mal15_03050 [Stieleria maiorica]|uniref:DUF6868 domain-containing protein n=1 Tax=Stieleria maiorica TaxID=2795974 RepID=A0A5B9M508_9BACT|nr:hypothetical protein [Stieleria maiorica]QEF96278.1 hypothetical protein Mal15_03050 [Stieleria maiorica]
MASLEVLLTALGWSTLINLGMLTLSAALLAFWGEAIGRLHQKWFLLEKRELQQAYFRYLANYKLLVLVFNLVPYLALRLALR